MANLLIVFGPRQKPVDHLIGFPFVGSATAARGLLPERSTLRGAAGATDRESAQETGPVVPE